MRRTSASMVCAGLLGLLAGGSALADLPAPPPAGMKEVPTSVAVDFGPLAERIGERYTVQPRDTLLSIARKQSADPAAWKALAAANRATLPDPDRLRVGDVLWVPPKARLAAARAGTVTPAAHTTEYALIWVVANRDREILWHGRGTDIAPSARGNSFTVCLVPAESAASLLKVADGSARPPGSTAATPGTVSAEIAWPSRFYPSSERAARIDVVARVKGIDGSRLVLKTGTVRYDAAGSVLAEGPPATPEAAGDEEAILIASVPGVPTPSGALLPAPDEVDTEEGRFPTTLALIVAASGLLVLVLARFVTSKPAAPPEA